MTRRSGSWWGKVQRLAFLVVVLAGSQVVFAEEQASLQCDVGPVKKEYGHSSWLVYACVGSPMIVLVSETGAPAFPFYFTLTPNEGGVAVQGEGTGSKVATDATYKELIGLSAEDV